MTLKDTLEVQIIIIKTDTQQLKQTKHEYKQKNN